MMPAVICAHRNGGAFTERNLHVHKEFGHFLTSSDSTLAALSGRRCALGPLHSWWSASYFAHQRFMERLGFAPG